jgi:hypothetical protein
MLLELARRVEETGVRDRGRCVDGHVASCSILVGGDGVSSGEVVCGDQSLGQVENGIED